jgi:hypothetical protein
MCTCKELEYVDDEGITRFITPTKFHDCAYVKTRNSFLSKAERLANEQKQNGNAAPWNKLYLDEVDRLVAEHYKKGERKWIQQT